jgi:multicomponent Na+:H+ antiporter subunit D
MGAEILILLPLVIPVISALVSALCHHKPRLRDQLTVIFAAVLLINIINLVIFFINGTKADFTIIAFSSDLYLGFALEPLGLFGASLTSFSWLLISIYMIRHSPTRHHYFMPFTIALTIAMAFSGNLLTVFSFTLLLVLCTYPLLTQTGRLTLCLLLAPALLLFLPAILWIWLLTGTIDFQIGGIISGRNEEHISLLLAMFTFGIVGAALTPVHPASIPANALVRAVTLAPASVVTLLKIITYVFSIDTLRLLMETGSSAWLLYASGLTAIAASFMALRQEHITQKLAYSTISQLALCVMAAALFTENGITAALVQLAAYGLGAMTLCLAAGSLSIGRIGFILGVLSLIGIPPTIGFMSIYTLLGAAADAESYTIFVVLMLNSLLTSACFLPLLFRSFFGAADHSSFYQQDNFWAKLAILLCSLTIIIAFLISGSILHVGKIILY